MKNEIEAILNSYKKVTWKDYKVLSVTEIEIKGVVKTYLIIQNGVGNNQKVLIKSVKELKYV